MPQTATTQTKKYCFTLAELKRLTDDDLPGLGRNSERWQEAVLWLGDYDHYRDRRLTEAAEIAEAKLFQGGKRPAPAAATPAPAPARTGNAKLVTMGQLLKLDSIIAKGVRETVFNPLVERLTLAENRVLVAEARNAALEKRLVIAERRLESQQRHLRNHETRITGNGKLEHGGRVKDSTEETNVG